MCAREKGTPRRDRVKFMRAIELELRKNDQCYCSRKEHQDRLFRWDKKPKVIVTAAIETAAVVMTLSRPVPRKIASPLTGRAASTKGISAQ